MMVAPRGMMNHHTCWNVWNTRLGVESRSSRKLPSNDYNIVGAGYFFPDFCLANPDRDVTAYSRSLGFRHSPSRFTVGFGQLGPLFSCSSV
jgi:hypothetical protein